MKSTLLVVLLLAGSAFSTRACEACGCGISFGSPGPMVLQQRHFIGWMTTFQRFQYPEGNTSDLLFQTELWGRWAFHPRWALTARVPYHWNQRSGENADPVTIQGIGDPSLSVRFLAFQQKDSSKIQQTVFVQAESRLPLSPEIRPEGSSLPFRLFPGQQQVVQQASVLHQVMLAKGLSLTSELSATGSLTDDLSYRLAPQIGASTLISWSGESRVSRRSVWAGLAGVWQGRDVEAGFYRNDTGGQGLSLLLGSQWEREQVSIGLQAQLPLWQQFGEDALISLPAAQVFMQFRI